MSDGVGAESETLLSILLVCVQGRFLAIIEDEDYGYPSTL